MAEFFYMLIEYIFNCWPFGIPDVDPSAAPGLINPPADAEDDPHAIEGVDHLPDAEPNHGHDLQSVEHLPEFIPNVQHNLHMNNQDLVDQLFNNNLPEEFIIEDQIELLDE